MRSDLIKEGPSRAPPAYASKARLPRASSTVRSNPRHGKAARERKRKGEQAQHGNPPVHALMHRL